MWGSPELCYTKDRTPDPLFVKKLQAYDDKLFVRWNAKFRRFEIWRHAKAGPSDHAIHILPVKFPKLDDRVLNKLKERDLWRYGRKQYGKVNDLGLDIDNYNDHVKLAQERDLLNKCEGLASDKLWYIMKREFDNPKSRAFWNVPMGETKVGGKLIHA